MKLRWITAVLLLIVGCTVGPDYKQPVAPEIRAPLFVGGSITTTDSLAFWWRNFDDPLLTEFVEQGLATSPTVEAAIARLRAARALREGVEGSYWPQFSADGSYRWSRDWGNSQSTKKWNETLNTSADARWEIDLFGSVRRSVEQAEAEERKLAYTLQDVRVSLAAEIARTYVMVRQYQAQVTLVQTSILLQERNAEMARQRYTAQTSTRYDLATAIAQLARIRASLPALRQSLTEAMLKLDWLTGQVPYATQQRISETQDVMCPPSVTPKTLSNELLRRRADIRVAEESIHAQTAAVGIATAEIYPKFYLNGTIGLSAPDIAPLSDYTRNVGFGPSASWNVFGFGTYRKRIAAAKETLTATVADYTHTVLQAYQEAEAAWNAYHNEAERTADLIEAENQHQIAYDIALRVYKEGEADFSNVISQQGNLLSLQETIATHRAALFSDVILLYKTLGGGWADESATPNEPLVISSTANSSIPPMK